MFPADALAERIVMEDDVIPLSKPIQATDIISWAIYELAQDPELQSQLCKELEDLGREPTFDDLHNSQDLKLLDAITKEA